MVPHFIIDQNQRTIRATTVITTEEVKKHPRSSIKHITPYGYNSIKDGNIYILHRTHIIADQLLPQGKSAVPENIISGTFNLNIKLMLPIENQIKQFVKRNGISVNYCVEPLYHDDCLIPFALHLKAISLEKNPSLKIDIILPNEQPDYTWDYHSGTCKKTNKYTAESASH